MQILGGMAQVPYALLRLSQSVKMFLRRKIKVQPGMIELFIKNAVSLPDPAFDAVRRLYLFYLCIFIHHHAVGIKRLHAFAFPVPFGKQQAAVRPFIRNGTGAAGNPHPQISGVHPDFFFFFLPAPEAAAVQGQIGQLRPLFRCKTAVFRIGNPDNPVRLRQDADKP